MDLASTLFPVHSDSLVGGEAIHKPEDASSTPAQVNSIFRFKQPIRKIVKLSLHVIFRMSMTL